MERLHQVMNLLAVVGCLASGLYTASAQDGCSLVVRALSPDGRRPKVPVSVTEQGGRVEEGRQNDTDVRFCDLGILPVTVTVGSNTMCGQVTVHDVQLSLDETHLLTVIYDPDACHEKRIPTPIPSCLVLFRVADTAGKWVPGASVHISSPTPDTETTDEFGRALFEAKVGSRLDVLVTAVGFRPTAIKWACPDQDSHEENVKLEKKP